MNKLSKEEVESRIKNSGYRLLTEYKNVKDRVTVSNCNGYLYYVVLWDLFHNVNFQFVGKHNPYSIQNINRYLEINNLETTCVSDSFEGCNKELKFKCGCGNVFYQKWPLFKDGVKKCDKCKYSTIYNKKSTEEIVQHMMSKGFSVLKGHEGELQTRPLCVHCINKDGYKGIFKPQHLFSDKAPALFHPQNPYTIDNINIFLGINTDNDYICLSDVYVNKTSPLRIKHLKCGREFEASWVNLNRKPSSKDVNRHGSRCPFCEAGRIESIHALILKQVYRHEIPSVSIEDRSCINPRTGCVMPTDLVDHKNKIAIEIQSWFHDPRNNKTVDEYRLWKDKYKKEYWISNGYQFYDPDHRDYTPLQIIQLFFPYIEEVPDYVDIGYSNKINESEVQKVQRALERKQKRKIRILSNNLQLANNSNP